MIAALILLAVAAGAGWTLALALLVGRAIALADRRAGNVVDVAPGGPAVWLDGAWRPLGAGPIRLEPTDLGELELETRLPRRRRRAR